MSVGSLFFELDLDTTKFTKLQEKLNADIKNVAQSTNEALQLGYQNLGVKADVIFKLMADKAEAAYARITTAAGQSAKEQFRAQSAAIDQINKLQNEFTKNPLFDALGVKSQAAIEAQKQAYLRAQATIMKSTEATALDKINITAATNAKIIALDNELNAIQIANDKATVASAKAAAAEKLAAQEKWAADEMALRSRRRAAQEQQAASEMAYRKGVRDFQEKQAASYMTEMDWQKKMEATKSEAWAENARRTEEAAKSTRAQGLMQLEATKMDLDRTKAAQEQKIKALNQHYSTLGMKSAADIKQRIADVNTAATAQQAIVGKSSDDWVRIERAKNARLKELNNEMVGQHEISMASMMRAVLRFYAAYYVASQALSLLTVPFKKGFDAVEAYSQSVASLAAMVVTFSEAKIGQSLSKQWEEALSYSTAMVPVLEKIAARTLLSGQETTALANAFARSGVFLRANNSAQIEGFARISNALPLMTKGQEIMRQINTEIRSVMTGQNEQSSMMLQTLKALPGFSKENLEIWRQQGTVLENVGRLLEGFGPATELLENQWQAVKSTLDTTVTQILRGGMLGAYGELILSAKDLDVWLNKNKDSLIDGMSKWVGNFLLSMYTIKAEVLRLAMLLDKMGGTMTSAKILLYGPGAAMGVKSSKQRFEAAAKSNIEYENRFKESEKELEQLAIRYNNLEQSISAAGLAAAKAARDGKAANQEFKAKAAIDEKTIKKTKTEEDIQKQLTDIIRKNQFERDQIGKDTYDKELLRIDYEAKKYKEAGWTKVQIDQFIYEEQSTAIAKWEQENLKIQMKAKEDYSKQMSDKEKSIRKGAAETAAEVDKLNKSKADAERKIYTDLRKSKESYYDSELELISRSKEEFLKAGVDRSLVESWVESQTALAVEKTLATTADFYSSITGYADEAFQKRMDQIEAERQRNSVMYDEKMANEKAMQQIIEARGKLWDDEHSNIKSIMASNEDMVGSAAEMFDKESSQYKTLMQMKQVMHAADMAMNMAKQISNYQTLLTEIAKAKASGATAVAQQAQIPVVGFAMAASMVAFLASVFSSLGVSFGGGASSGGSAPILSPSTVLGAEAGKGSESISKSWELLQDTYDMEYHQLSGIYEQVKSLNQNITGLVTSIIRTGSVNPSSWDVPGEKDSIFQTFTSSQFSQGIMGGGLGYLTSEAISAIKIPIISDIASMVSGIFETVGGWANSIIGGIFGGGSESFLVESGIRAAGMSVSQLRSGASLSGEAYGVIQTNVDKGVFRGDDISFSTQANALDAATNQLFTNVFKGLGNTLVSLSTSLGTDVQSALNYTFADMKLNLGGLSSEDVNKTVSEFISNTADTAVQALFGTILAGYQKIGEGLMETATRLVIDKEVVFDTLKMTGGAFVGTTKEMIAFSESLIELAGDLSTLRDAAETYYDKFFSDTEKQARLQEQLVKSMAAANMIMPATREGYRNIVEGLNLQTEAGQKQYVTLMKLSNAADEYYSALDDIADKQQQVTESLKKQSDMTAQWLREINMNTAIAPVTSSTAMINEYERLKGIAKSPAGTETDTSNFLNYTKDYLSYMRTYSNDYKAIYDKVIADVQGLNTVFEDKVANAQLEAANALKDAAAELSRAGYSMQLANIVGSSGFDPGLSSTATLSKLMATIGTATKYPPLDPSQKLPPLYVTPTTLEGYAQTLSTSTGADYAELLKLPVSSLKAIWDTLPEHKAGLDYVPYDNYVAKLHKGEKVLTAQENSQANSSGTGNWGPDQEIVIPITITLDGNVLAETTAKYIPRNGNLTLAIKKAAA